jgi:hypothetical protein
VSSDPYSSEPQVFTCRKTDELIRFGFFGIICLVAGIATPFLGLPALIIVAQSLFIFPLALLLLYMFLRCLNERVVISSGELVHYDWLGRERARFFLSEIERVDRSFSTRIITSRGETKLYPGMMPKGRELLELLLRKGDAAKPLEELLSADIKLDETVVYKHALFERMLKPLLIVIPTLFVFCLLMLLFMGMPEPFMSMLGPMLAAVFLLQGLMLVIMISVLRKRSVTISPSEVVVQDLMRSPRRIPITSILSIKKVDTSQGYYLALETTDGLVRLPFLGSGERIQSHVSALIIRHRN